MGLYCQIWHQWLVSIFLYSESLCSDKIILINYRKSKGQFVFYNIKYPLWESTLPLSLHRIIKLICSSTNQDFIWAKESGKKMNTKRLRQNQLENCTLVKKSWMNQENAYSKGCEVKYLLESKTSVELSWSDRKNRNLHDSGHVCLLILPTFLPECCLPPNYWGTFILTLICFYKICY